MFRVFKYFGILLVLELIIGLGAVIPTQAAMTISLSSSSGSPGNIITVSGTSTNPSDTISITFDTTSLTTTTASANSPYSWSVSVTIPQAASNISHTINVSGGGGTASYPFTIIPKTTLSQISGSVGNTMMVTGSGFAQSEIVTINFNGTSVGTGYADAINGDWTSSFTVPSLVAGSYTINFIGSTGESIPSQTFTVISTAAISLSRTSGQVGSSLSMSGSGFLANETITVTFDGNPVGTTTTASSTGSWTDTFPIPEVPSGSHTIGAYGTTTAAASVTGISFSVTPSFTINKTSGSAMTSVTATGSGFASGEQGIVVTIDGSPVGSPVQANATGSWTDTISIPVLTGGVHTVSAQSSTTPSSSLSPISFTVGAGISLNKNSGTAGGSLTVTGSGFQANEQGIAVTYDGNPIGSPVSANDEGSWTANITIPPSAGGTHAITASGPQTSASSITGTNFTIQATLSPLKKTSGPVGDTLTLNGSGFGANETGITITYDGNALGQPITASATGDWHANISIPPSTVGSHDIKVSGQVTQTTSPSALSYDVVSSLTLGSDKGYVGGTVNLSGAGFTAGSDLKITYDDNPIPDLKTVTTDDSGSFSQSFPAPKSLGGDHAIKAIDAQNNTGNVTFTIDVTPPAEPKLASPMDGERIGFTGNVVTTFKWAAVTSLNAPVTYNLQVDNNPDFASPILEKDGLDTNSYTLSQSEALPMGTYYWRVQSIDAASNQSPWSQPRELQGDLMSTPVLILLIILVLAALVAVVYILIIRPRMKAQRAAAPEIVIPEVVNAEYREIGMDEQAKRLDDKAKRKSLPWRLALPQAPPTPKGAKSLSPEDQARLKVIFDFAKSLPLVEPGSNTNWLVDMAENISGNTVFPSLYAQILKGEIQLRYEPGWMKHPTFLDLQTLLEGQPILQDLNSFVETANRTTSEAVFFLQDIYKNITSEVTLDILANGGWAYISGIYADSLRWFQGKYLHEPSEREYILKQEGQNSGDTNIWGLYGEANTPFAGLLIKAPSDEETVKLRDLHIKLRRVYRNNDKGRAIVSMLTQLDVERSKLLNAFSQFNRLGAL